MDYVFHILVMFVIYGLLSLSLELVVGRLGLLALCQAALCGVGAYTSAILMVNYRWTFFSSTTAAILLTSALSVLVSAPSFRLMGDYFSIVTFGIQVVLWQGFNNISQLTGGPMGISPVPRPNILGWSPGSPGAFLLFATGVGGVCLTIVFLVVHSPFGRVLLAIREDVRFVATLGKNPTSFKIQAFALSAGLAAIAGTLYASYSTYIDPSNFALVESILIASMVIIGGAGSLWGPLLGAFVLVTVPEALRFVGLPGAIAADLRQVLYGSLLVILMMFRPRGLLGNYSFTK
jgi:branched-chain amino acid transport system permease protein